jgi:hypothetical protein
MEDKKLTIAEQVRIALDGRTQRWLSFEVRIPEPDLSRKMKGEMNFMPDEIERINTRLGSTITLPQVEA